MAETNIGQMETGSWFNNMEQFRDQTAQESNIKMMDEVNKSRTSSIPNRSTGSEVKSGQLEFTPLY